MENQIELLSLVIICIYIIYIIAAPSIVFCPKYYSIWCDIKLKYIFTFRNRYDIEMLLTYAKAITRNCEGGNPLYYQVINHVL